MAEHDDDHDDLKFAKWTFYATALLAVLYVGSIVVFILSR